MNEKLKRDMRVLKSNLKNIRQLAGWGLQDVADLLDCTPQTVSNWENTTDKDLSKFQYISIRVLLDHEIKQCIKKKKKFSFVYLTYTLIYMEKFLKEDELKLNEALDIFSETMSYVAGMAASGMEEAEVDQACFRLCKDYIFTLFEYGHNSSNNIFDIITKYSSINSIYYKRMLMEKMAGKVNATAMREIVGVISIDYEKIIGSNNWAASYFLEDN